MRRWTTHLASLMTVGFYTLPAWADAPRPSLAVDTIPSADPPPSEPLYTPTLPSWQTAEPDWVRPSPAEIEPEIETEPQVVYEDGGTWLERLRSLRPPSNGRHRGRGNPLERESWLYRPYSLGALGGAYTLQSPRQGLVAGSTGYLAGARAGIDFDHFWGLETRIAGTKIALNDPGGQARLGDCNLFVWDNTLLYYPWGDAQWRPFGTIGIGLGDFSFYDEQNRRIHQTLFTMPFGLGLKYRANGRWVLRFDVLDNLTFGGGNQINTMNNLSITAGIEARLGIGQRTSYWPWNPSRRGR